MESSGVLLRVDMLDPLRASVTTRCTEDGARKVLCERVGMQDHGAAGRTED